MEAGTKVKMGKLDGHQKRLAIHSTTQLNHGRVGTNPTGTIEEPQARWKTDAYIRIFTK